MTNREKAIFAYSKAASGAEDLIQEGWQHVLGKYRDGYRHNIQDPNGMNLCPGSCDEPGGWDSKSREDAQARVLVASANLVPHILADAIEAPSLRSQIELFQLTAWQLKGVGVLDKLRKEHRKNSETLDSLDHLEEAAMAYEKREELQKALRASVEAAERKRGGGL